jgi:phosphoserine phosphatase RsbX
MDHVMDPTNNIFELEKIVSGTTSGLEWSAIRFPMRNENVSGDLFYITKYQDKVLIAVIDGLGHGNDAYSTSLRAIESLKSFSNQPLVTIINNCHTKLKNTRGVVMNLAVFDNEDRSVKWVGVGNVEGILYHKEIQDFSVQEDIIAKGGVVGYNIPVLKPVKISVMPGDTFIFTTDGVDTGYRYDIDLNLPPEKIVKIIATNYIDHSDDSLVLVVRYSDQT